MPFRNRIIVSAGQNYSAANSMFSSSEPLLSSQTITEPMMNDQAFPELMLRLPRAGQQPQHLTARRFFQQCLVKLIFSQQRNVMLCSLLY